MGSTIRRQPVNFKIPSSPDYKFFNVTDFRGLEMTDNPFTANSNTASDLLNVYVDENNALTTRPRLEKQYEIGKNIPKFNRVLYSYKLMDKIIFQVLINSTIVRLYYKQGDNLVLIDNDTNNIALPETKLAIFEKKDKIYVMTGTLYCVIKSDNIMYSVRDDEDTYVPTTGISTINDNGIRVMADYEQKNILSNKYKIQYFWDLESDIYSEFEANGKLIKNDYLKQYKSDELPLSDNIFSLGKILTDNNILVYSGPSTGEWKAKRFYLEDGKINNDDAITILERQPICFSSNGKWFVVPDSDYTGFTVKGDRETHVAIDTSTFKLNRDAYVNMQGFISNNGDYVYVIVSTDFTLGKDDNEWKLLRFTYDPTKGEYVKNIPFEYTNVNLDENKQINAYDARLLYGNSFSDVIITSSFALIYLSDIISTSEKSQSSGTIYSCGELAYASEVVVSNDLTSIGILSSDKNNVFIGSLDSSTHSVLGVNKYVESKIEHISIKGNFQLRIMTDNDVYVYTLNDDFYKLYSLQELPKSDYYLTQTTHNLIISADGLLAWRLQRNRTDSTNIKPEDDYIVYVDVLESSTEPLITVEYSSPDDVSYTDKKEYVVSERLSEESSNITVSLNSYDKVHIVKFLVYNTDESAGKEHYVDLSVKDRILLGLGTGYGSLYYQYDGNNLIITPSGTTILNKRIDIIVTYSNIIYNPGQTFDFNGILRFQNNFWFYGNGNEIRWTGNNDPTYFPEYNYTNLGDTNDFVNDMLMVSYDTAIAFKQNNMYVITPTEISDGGYTFTFVEAKTDIGVIAPQSSIISPLTETPLYVNARGIYGIRQLKNIQSTDRISVLYSENVNKKYLNEDKKSHIQTISRLYWVLFIIPGKITKIYVFDDRTSSWYYWEIPINVTGCWADELNSYFASDDGKIYMLKTNDIIDTTYSPETEYYDDGRKLIPWYWKSQILSLGTINYSKKLINTTFILTDTDENEEYGLNYKFKAYRKIVSETNATTISNRLNYIQSTTKKTTIPRFNFLQMELSNVEEDLNNNKLRLVGLGLKYELLEGLS